MRHNYVLLRSLLLHCYYIIVTHYYLTFAIIAYYYKFIITSILHQYYINITILWKHHYIVITKEKSCNNDPIVTCYAESMLPLLRHYYVIIIISSLQWVQLFNNYYTLLHISVSRTCRWWQHPVAAAGRRRRSNLPSRSLAGAAVRPYVPRERCGLRQRLLYPDHLHRQKARGRYKKGRRKPSASIVPGSTNWLYSGSGRLGDSVPWSSIQISMGLENGSCRLSPASIMTAWTVVAHANPPPFS